MNQPAVSASPPKLLDRRRAKIRLKHYSIRTEIYTHVLNKGVRSPLDTL
jgi:hypothetical protein